MLKFILKEIYAPKLQEFAYVTDGACSEEDILRMELIILKVIDIISSCNSITVIITESQRLQCK